MHIRFLTAVGALLLSCAFSHALVAETSLAESRSPRPGAIIRIATVRASKLSAENITVTVGIAASGPVDHNAVLVQVFFYDVVADGTRVAVTNLKGSYNWLTKPPDWSTREPEVLSVTRMRSTRESQRRAVPPLAGYAIRVYYRGELQHAVADPHVLLTLFPPPPRQPTKNAAAPPKR